MRFFTVVLLLLITVAYPAAQEPAPVAVDPLHKPFDEILDLYVRDGLVYYYALRQERAKFDRYVAALGAVGADTVAKWPQPRRLAYWINAYNAFVLRTVIDHYPIRGKAADYPANSIRQISGAFERRTFRAAGRMLTLDAIERDVIGSRLKSEAFTADRLDQQLTTMAGELVTRRELVEVDAINNRLSVNPMFSWREDVFARTLAHRAPDLYASRSPLERAVLALIEPLIVPGEREFLRKNGFSMVFHEFDWRLNDLTGR